MDVSLPADCEQGRCWVASAILAPWKTGWNEVKLVEHEELIGFRTRRLRAEGGGRRRGGIATASRFLGLAYRVSSEEELKRPIVWNGERRQEGPRAAESAGEGGTHA